MDDDAKKAAYVYSERFEGAYPHEIELADHYNDSISTAYGGAVGAMEDVEEDEADDTKMLSEDEQACLETAAEWEIENRPVSHDITGFDHEEMPVSYAWNPLQSLNENGYIEKLYSSNNTATRYALTEKGWDVVDYNEPDGPRVEVS